MNNKYLVIHGSANDRYEAILMCGEALYAAGIVGKSFGNLCIEREKEYPTGLPTEIPTAIPHTKDASVRENSICLLKLDKPVTFQRMDDDTESVETDLIFNLAIKNPDEHLQVLQNMMVFLNDSERLNRCRELPDEELISYLEETIG